MQNSRHSRRLVFHLWKCSRSYMQYTAPENVSRCYVTGAIVRQCTAPANVSRCYVTGSTVQYCGGHSYGSHVHKRTISKHRDLKPQRTKRRWNIHPTVARKQRESLLSTLPHTNSFIKIQEQTGKLPEYILDIMKTRGERAERVKMMAKLSVEDLKKVMQSLVNLRIDQSLKSTSLVVEQSGELILSLEGACVSKLKDFDISTSLLMTDGFLLLQHPQDVYLPALLNRVDLCWEQQTPSKEQLLQLLLYIGCFRNAPVTLLDRIEGYLTKLCQDCNTEFTGQQFGLVCHSFFISNRAIRSFSLLDVVAQTCLRDLDRLHPISIANIMKCFRHASYDKLDFYKSFGDQMCGPGKAISVHTLSTLAQICHAYASLGVSHRLLANRIALQSEQLIQMAEMRGWSMRTKDCILILSFYAATGQILTVPRHLVATLLRQLRDDPQLHSRFPEVFVEALVNLAMIGEYPEDLISEALSPDSLSWRKNRLLEQNRELLLLDAVADIMCRDYSGHRLKQDFVTAIPVQYMGSLGLELHIRKGLGAIWWTLQELLGDPTKVRAGFVLPFSKIADLQLELDNHKQPVSLCLQTEDSTQLQTQLEAVASRIESKEQSGNSVIENLLVENQRQDSAERQWHRKTSNQVLKTKPSQTSRPRRITVKVMGWNQYRKNEDRFTGSTQVELNLLAEAGYDVLLISPSEASRLTAMSVSERRQYVEEEVLQKMDIQL